MNGVGCGVAVVGISQPHRKSIPAIVLILERSVGVLRISSVFMVMLWRGCGGHLTAAQKKYTGNSFKFGKVCGGYLCLLFLLSLSLSLSLLSLICFLEPTPSP